MVEASSLSHSMNILPTECWKLREGLRELSLGFLSNRSSLSRDLKLPELQIDESVFSNPFEQITEQPHSNRKSSTCRMSSLRKKLENANSYAKNISELLQP